MTDGRANHLDFRTRRSDMWKHRGGIFTVCPSMNVLATTYAFTGDVRIGDYARDALMTIVENGLADFTSVAYGATSKGWRRGAGHDKALFGQAICYVYDFCFDRFTDAQRRRLYEYVTENIALADEWRTFDNEQVCNNRGSRGIMTPAMYCLAFEGEMDIPESEERIARGFVAFEKFLFQAFDPDGAPYEGPAYTEGNVYQAAFATMLTRRGLGDFASNNRFERYLKYLLYESVPGQGCVNNLNDANWPCGSVSTSLISAGRPEAAILPWLARRLDLAQPRVANWLDSEDFTLEQMHERCLYWLLWWRDEDEAGGEVRSPQQLGLPNSFCFRERGVASLRSGWDDDAILASHFCGRQQLYCHRQADQNHVALYALGETFLVDAGYGTKNEDPKKPKDDWYKRTAAHNCVLIDGRGQRGVSDIPGWAAGQMLDFAETPQFTTSLGDASSSGSGKMHRLRRSLRRVTLVHSAKTPYVAILDLVETDGSPFDATFLWHTHPDNRIEQTSSGLTIRGRKHDCVAQILWPESRNPVDITLGNDHGRPGARIAARGTTIEMLTIFCPIRRGESAPIFSCSRDAEGRFTVEPKGGEPVSISVV